MEHAILYFLAGMPAGYFAHWLYSTVARPNGKRMHFGVSNANAKLRAHNVRIVIPGRGGWESGSTEELEYMRGTRPARDAGAGRGGATE